jgi:hypothetical protein
MPLQDIGWRTDELERSVQNSTVAKYGTLPMSAIRVRVLVPYPHASQRGTVLYSLAPSLCFLSNLASRRVAREDNTHGLVSVFLVPFCPRMGSMVAKVLVLESKGVHDFHPCLVFSVLPVGIVPKLVKNQDGSLSKEALLAQECEEGLCGRVEICVAVDECDGMGMVL